MQQRILLTLLLLCLPFLAAASAHAGLQTAGSDTAIVLSEIMYDQPTASASDEFIELYNTSPTLPVDLAGWKITGSLTGYAALSDTGKGETVLAPNSYAVIFPSGYFSVTHLRFYQDVIPAGTLVLKSDKSLSLNNDSDSLIVMNAQGDTVIAMKYTDKTDKGYSLEKVILNGGDSMENYAPGQWLNGTPGRRNTVAPAKFDLAIKTSAEVIGSQQRVTLLPYKVMNAGERSFGKGCVVRLHKDSNSNGVGEDAELVDSFTLPQDLNSTDSVQLSFSYTPQTSGSVRFVFSLTNALDENQENDTAKITLVIRTMRDAVVINEILYEPIQNPDDFIQDQPDFIELYNRTSEPVDLRGWTISDRPNEQGEFDTYLFAEDPSGNYILNPGAYAVVSPDKATNPDSTRLVLYYTYLRGSASARLFYVKTRSTFSLSNEGDLVLLRDKTGAVADSVAYIPGWHNEFYSSTAGKSLERLNPDFPGNDSENWSTSTDRSYGATPGKANSIFTPSPLASQTTSLVIEPRTFSPDSDGRDDFAVISYKLSGQVNRIRVKIFDVRGRLIQTLSSSLPSGAGGQVIWDGRDQNGRVARMGIYIVLLEALNAENGVTETVKNTLVLARRLN